jgi:hypothetical protein
MRRLLLLLLLPLTLHAQTIPESRIREHVRYLASDKLAGRRTGSEGNRLAADYIAREFRKYKLQPMTGSREYFQTFDYLSGYKTGRNNHLTLATPGGLRHLKVGEDFIPLYFSGQRRARTTMVFAGYGISAPDQNYDDYAGLDVKGKVVVMMRQSPDGSNPHGRFGSGASITAKSAAARERGAAGIVLIDPPGVDAIPVSTELQRGFLDAGLAVVYMPGDPFADLRDESGRSIADIRRMIDSSRAPSSFVMRGWVVDLATDVELVRRKVPNVVGMLRGSDPVLRNEMIVIGGHFDHLGWGGEGSLYAGKDSAIHYGADDNASGTAGMLALAEQFARAGGNRRTLVFMAFNGEEEGLLGSEAIAKSFPNERVAAMINMDMIGRLDSAALIVQGVGTSPVWPALLAETNRDRFTLKQIKDGTGPSDHSSFYLKKVPVLFFFTGTHSDYHRPGDTWEKINYPGEAEILGFVADIIRAIDARPERPTYTEVVNESARSNMGFKVYVGSIPDYGFEGTGLRLNGVAAGGPAEKAGLREGDIIVRMGSRSIANIYDYTAALGELAAGDRVEFEYIRDGVSRTTVVEMGGR